MTGRDGRGPITRDTFAPRCEYCDAPGCHWSRHPAARADVAAWQRELARLLAE